MADTPQSPKETNVQNALAKTPQAPPPIGKPQQEHRALGFPAWDLMPPPRFRIVRRGHRP